MTKPGTKLVTELPAGLQEYLDGYRNPTRIDSGGGPAAEWNRRPAAWAHRPQGMRARTRHAVRTALPSPVYRFARERSYDVRTIRHPGADHVLPDFLVAGAAKAGTTSLFNWLGDHPLVAEAPKEIHFFNENFFRRQDWYRQHFPTEQSRMAFASENGRPFLTGEGTASYLSHPWAARRAAKLLPDVKVIFTLRNPIDRAYSQFNATRRAVGEPLESFEEALANERDRLGDEVPRVQADPHYSSWPFRNWSYLYRGHYAKEIELWLDVFPSDHILILKAEDMWADPYRALDTVHEFLGLPPHRPAQLPHLKKGEGSPPISPETRHRLAAYFRPDNERLSELVGIDFGWTA